MQLTNVLYRRSAVYFATFFALIVWGFWRTYYSNPLEIGARTPNVAIVQFHAIVMTVWCVMLVAQACLIRFHKRALHRLVGTASYVVAPLVVISQVVVIRNLLILGASNEPVPPMDIQYVLSSYTLGASLLFVIFYSLAILNRRESAVHGRFMVCTALPFLGAGVDRIVSRYLPGVIDYLPALPGISGGFVQGVAFLIEDVVLLVLAAWDWRSQRRLGVFAFALVLMVAHHVFTVFAHRIPLWASFFHWFTGT